MAYYSYTSQLDILLQHWQEMGVFSVIVPFILIFAVVFAILQKSRILGARPSIDTIVAFALGFGALQFDFVTRAFTETFMRGFGIAVIVLVGAVILFGLFINQQETQVWRIIGSILAAIALLVILIVSYGQSSWTASEFWRLWGGYVVIGVIILGLILLMTLPQRGIPAQVRTAQG